MIDCFFWASLALFVWQLGRYIREPSDSEWKAIVQQREAEKRIQELEAETPPSISKDTWR